MTDFNQPLKSLKNRESTKHDSTQRDLLASIQRLHDNNKATIDYRPYLKLPQRPTAYIAPNNGATLRSSVRTLKVAAKKPVKQKITLAKHFIRSSFA